MIGMLRLARVGLHLGYGMATVALVYPLIGRAAQLRLKQRWSRQLLGMLGVRLQAETMPLPSSTLLVANHVSWLDIYVINALAPAAFVCKAEVRDWPLIGWLCERTETVFMPRGNRSAARQTSEIVAARLRQGWTVAVFPEGTTSDGSRVLPFHGALLQGAVAAGCRIQPLALSYAGRDGRPSSAPAYCGDITLMQSLRSIAAAAPLLARLAPVAPLETRGTDRRRLAEAARGSIQRELLHHDAAGAGSEVAGRECAAPEIRPAAA